MATIESPHRILIVDDNPSIHEDMRKILCPVVDDRLQDVEAELFGDTLNSASKTAPVVRFQVEYALQGQDALKIVEESVRTGNRFSLAFVDVRMPPGWDGIETIQRLWQVDPELEVVICTAYSDYSWQEIGAQLGSSDRYLILKKPFESVEVRQLAMTLTAKCDLRAAQAANLAKLEQTVVQRSADLETAQQGSQAKSEFLATMSHELRTPINGIVGMLELIDSTPLDDQQKRYLQGAQRSVSCLLHLINEVLDFSKIEAGKFELSPVEFSLSLMLEDVAEMMAPQAQQKGLEICCDIAADLPALVHADADRLRQVVLNLANNAVKFTDRGQITLRARTGEKSSEGTWFRIEVEDTGIGIPSDRMDRLFQAFSQVDTSTTRRYGGTGLGLSLCKRLVELFGGEIGVESTAGFGSKFWFTVRLPVVEKPETCRVIPSSLKHLRALVVDDNPTTLEIISGHLQRWGIFCHTMNNSFNAVNELKEARRQGRPYGLLLLDFHIQGIDSCDLVQEILAIAELKQAPIIMMTSHGHKCGCQSKLPANSMIYLNKPIRPSRLFNAIIRATCEGPQEKLLERPGAKQKLPWRPSGSEFQVLVAEDNEINQVVVAGLLGLMNIKATMVDNGIDAVQQAQTKQFDLVLMDCQMPGLDGFAASTAIREQEDPTGGWARRGGRLPIIALTANAVSGDRERCLAAGMDDYYTKPINRAVLGAIFERWFPQTADDHGAP
ncbi:MAG: response regulator, partial [Pirellulales bacterium]|nr:response regulator [Pirellulales bacterium]